MPKKEENEEMLYIAYGSNLNVEAMRRRCPSAVVAGTGFLHGYGLVFRTYLTAEPNEKKELPVAVWQITPSDEAVLDEYEGFPALYRKEYLEVELDGTPRRALIYLMNDRPKHHPTDAYFADCLQGYRDFSFNTQYLYDALTASE